MEISIGEDLDALIDVLELALGIADSCEPLPKGRRPKRAHFFFDQMPEAMACIGEVARGADRTRTLPEGVIESAVMGEAHRDHAHPRHAKDGFHVLVTRLELTLSQDSGTGWGCGIGSGLRRGRLAMACSPFVQQPGPNVKWIFVSAPALHMMAGASEFPFGETERAYASGH